MSEEECHRFGNVATYINTVEDSKRLDTNKIPKVIISASGMATGGRVLYHIKSYAKDNKSTILFTGYQALETRGKRMLEGEKEIKMLGELVSIQAEIEIIHNLSAHADYVEILNWLGNFKRAPKTVFINHGEQNASQVLKKNRRTFWLAL